MDSTFQTKSSRIYESLRQDITNGEYKPGHHLVRRSLVKRFGVSLSIVNEALARLSSDGLVETKEMFGTRVINLDERQLLGEFALREAIECQAVRMLTTTATDTTLTELMERARTLDGELATRRDEDLSMIHLQFHLDLVEATGFAQLSETLKRTGIRSLMTKRWLKNQDRPHPDDFHERLITTIMQRDPVGADEEMRHHLHFPGTPGGVA